MKNVITYIIMGLTVLAFYACKHDAIETEIVPTCEDIPPTPSPFGFYNYIRPKYIYSNPSFNPNNSNELLFGRNNDVCVYNFQSNELRILVEDSVLSYVSWPCWGNNDWVYFPSKEGGLWKIKSNGDSLIQVMDNEWHSGIINTEKHKMAYHHRWRGLPGYTGNIYICDMSGNVLDSISGLLAGTWQNSDNIAMTLHLDQMSTKGTIQVVNPVTKEKIDVLTYNYAGNGEMGLCWIDNNTLIYFSEHEFYKIDIPSKRTTLLRTFCTDANYFYASYSLVLNRIVVCKTISKVVGYNLLEWKSKLYLLDVNGNEDRELVIPE